MSSPKPLRSVAVKAALVFFAASRLTAAPPESWRDDADLHAVHLVGRTTGWAVGDHGAALRTADGGRTWESRPVPEDLSLRAVCFVTDKIGWTAGATTVPYTRLETGAVFLTEDAGATWRRINTSPLPRLHAIRFFSLEEGAAAGAATPDCPSGVLTTSDGGITWQPIQTGTVYNPTGWRAAAFPEPGRGAVVGPRGRRSTVGGGQLIESRDPTSGLRGLNAVALVDPLAGWSAGDGGMILRTENGGLVWQDPAALLPPDARDLFDLQAVAAVGDKVWTAGRPGSVVWHSPDGGRSWRPQPTGSPLPIAAIRFSTPLDGVAVGSMGSILRTADGGGTWEQVRGAGRRAALLTIATRPGAISFPLVATLAGDQGYRAVAVLPVRHDLGPADLEQPNLDLRVHDAVTSAGGNAAVTDWPLPLTVPGVDRDQDALVAEWNRRTEGRLQRILVGRLTAAIRTWRPEIVVLDEPADGDAAAELILRASELAVADAADATKHLEHRLAALSPWTTKKVYVRTHDGATAVASIERDAPLTRLGLSAADLADVAASRIGEAEDAETTTEFFRLKPSKGGPAMPGPFFGGLAIAPNSDARRAVAEPGDDPRLAQLANRRRNFRSFAARSLDDAGQAAAVLAQIDELSAGLPPAQAARQLRFLADAHRARSRWDLAEQAYMTLVERYPHEPPAREAMTWLMRLWTGAEPVWRRMQVQGTATERRMASVDTLEARVETALRLAEEGIPAVTAEQIEAAGLGPDPLVASKMSGALRIDGARRWDDATVAHWRQQALRLGGVIRRVDPTLFSTPEVQFPIAAVLRGGGSSAAYLQRFAPDLAGGGWQPAAASELTLAKGDGSAPASTAMCRRAVQPPHLDAVISDPCWQSASEVPLASDPSAPLPEGSLVLFTYDEKFLYVAASVPRVPGRPAPLIELAGRTHDADLSPHDRIILSLDVDRDYTTSYRFAVDERGQTSDACWGDPAWNPNWFVAAEGQDDRWRTELAIPFAELGPRPPTAGELWAVSVGRIAPAAGVQGWPRPNDGEQRAESFGLMRFE